MGARVLIVEDNGLLALELARAVGAGGFNVVGPARTAANALKLIGREGCDAAVLDVHLGNETSERVALELRKLKTPFLVVSAYFSDQMPPAFGDALALRKPVCPRLLISGLIKCLEHPRCLMPSEGLQFSV